MKSWSRLEKSLREGKFTITAELGPPKSGDAEVIRKKAALIGESVTAVNVTDNQTAVVRMSSVAGAFILLEAGIEPVVQIVCRDRNRIAIQSDVLGAAAVGIRNVLCLTGDHQKFGNHPQARGVFDLDSVQLISMLRKMRDEARFECGEEIKNSKKDPPAPPQLFIGAAENPFGDPLEMRILRLGKKIAAGADFVQTQPVFDLNRFSQWMEGARREGLHSKAFILAGVMPVKSHRALEYMRKNVPGVMVPEELIERMKNASEPREEGMNVCVETINLIRKMEGVRGAHIMAVEWEESVPEIVKRAESRRTCD